MTNENKTFFAKGVSESKKFNWKDLFSGVFQKHTKDELDEVFASGLKGHIPADNCLLDNWQRPWVFSRFLVFGIIVWLILSIFFSVMGSTTDFGSIFLVTTSVVPVSMVLFFWEMNIPRNIPFHRVLMFFLCSGVAISLVFCFLHLLLNNDSIPQSTFIFWLIVGVVEELAKLILIVFIIRKAQYCWGLNGLVIGAAVGCGFAVFETVGYVLNTENRELIRHLIQFSNTHPDVPYMEVIDSLIFQSANDSMHTVTLRGITAINGHVIWAAMYGAALALAKGKQKLEAKHFGNPSVLISFFAAVLIHALFDYYNTIEDALFPEGSNLFVVLNTKSGTPVSYIMFVIIFAIPNYGIILWLIRKCVNQVVSFAGGAGGRIYREQVKPDSETFQESPVMPTPRVEVREKVLILECISGELAGQSYTIRKGVTYTIGRDYQSNVQYSNNAKGISRSHCNVTFDGNNAVVIDLGSSQGTYFENGLRFQPQMANPLKSGDRFYLAAPINTFRVNINIR